MVERKQITLKYIDSPGALPSPEFLAAGEVALNRADGLLYYLHTTGTVRAVRAEDVNLGSIGIISTSVPFPGLTYDSQGALHVANDVIRRQPRESQDTQVIQGPLLFSTELPKTSAGVTATEPEELVNLATLNSIDLDCGYF